MDAIYRGKEIIKQVIRVAQPGELAKIPVEDEANLAVFQRALRSPDVQRLAMQKNVKVELFIPESPVEQSKKYMLQVIRNADNEVREILFPVLAQQDYRDASRASSTWYESNFDTVT